MPGEANATREEVQRRYVALRYVEEERKLSGTVVRNGEITELPWASARSSGRGRFAI